MINVLFFAELREAIGQDKLTIEADDITVKELKDRYLKDYPLENLDGSMVAVNEEYAEENKLLRSGDVIAFIPPVSGG